MVRAAVASLCMSMRTYVWESGVGTGGSWLTGGLQGRGWYWERGVVCVWGGGDCVCVCVRVCMLTVAIACLRVCMCVGGV